MDRKWKPGDYIVHPDGRSMQIVLIEICERQAAFESAGWRLRE